MTRKKWGGKAVVFPFAKKNNKKHP